MSNREKTAWLERVLAATDKKFKIVAMHHTPVVVSAITVGTGINHNGVNNLPSKRSQLLNVLQRFGVQLVLSGHEHFYEKNILSYRDTAGSDQKMHIIVSGGGGVPLRDIADNESLARYLDYYRSNNIDITQTSQHKIYNFCMISINSELLTIKVYGVNEETENPVMQIDEIIINTQ